MNKIKIYVEGGGNRNLDSSLRKAFNKLLREYGICERNCKVIAGGDGGNALNSLVVSLEKYPNSIALIDSEEIIDTQSKLEHLRKTIKNQDKLKGITENNLFFMVVCMESWIVSDAEALKKHYGPGFKETKIQTSDLIHKDKAKIMKMLKDSIREYKNKEYDKSESFKILEKASVQKIVKSNSYAKEFFEFLKSKIPN
ncbi:DUF4276 family protein [Helicobacter rodentium]|uniref:DUF4276 family protein n=1 Tax=Helicobacter rodentium TaxID=59617 RepID=UPI0023F3B078|nr:DUF4276 family protein [Helicobacter rodentium]